MLTLQKIYGYTAINILIYMDICISVYMDRKTLELILL